MLAAAAAGKHVLVEKPACVTIAEAQSMIDACDAAGVVLMVAYPKRYEPSYAYAASRVQAMDDVRLIQINHLHPSNDLHMAEFSFHRANLPVDVALLGCGRRTPNLVAEALGLDSPADHLVRAYQLCNGSLIHDISVLHGMFGPPEAVLNTEIWRDGAGLTTTLRYPNDIRAVLTWIDLPDLWAFEETFAVTTGRSERVIVSFPTGFSRGLPTTAVIQEPDADGCPLPSRTLVARKSRSSANSSTSTTAMSIRTHPQYTRHRVDRPPDARARHRARVVHRRELSMAFRVFDSRTDIQNLIVHPDIRARFLQMEPGEENVPHTHDLGAEIFLILEGQAEFVIEGHTEVLGPGQLCFADRDEVHVVRCVGDSTMTMYLSVTPHIDPTHTWWDENGEKLPPRYGGSTTSERAAMDAESPPPPIADLAAAHAAAADEAAQAAEVAAEAQRTGRCGAWRRLWPKTIRRQPKRPSTTCGPPSIASFSANRELAAAWKRARAARREAVTADLVASPSPLPRRPAPCTRRPR